MKKLGVKQVWSIALEGMSQDLLAALKSVFVFCTILATLQFILTYGPMILLPKPINDTVMLVQRTFEVFWGIAVGVIYSIIVPYAVYKPRANTETLSGYLRRHFKLVSIETLRTLPIIIIYSLLFVIPGIIKMIRLIFVQYVVQLYRPYQEGKVDALKKSSELTQGALLGIATYFFVTQLIILAVVLGTPALLQMLFMYEPESLANLTVDFIFNVPIGVVIEMASAVGLLKIFEKIVILKEGQSELAF